MTAGSPAGLAPVLRQLGLSGMLDTLEARLAEARAGTLGHAGLLQVLCEDELARRDAAKITRRIKAARFPAADATLETFDFGYNPKLPAAAIRDLARLEFIAAGEGVLAYGPVGVGKSHLAAALGHQACRRGYDVAFTTCSRLLAHLAGGHADRSFEARVRDLAKTAVVIVDDFAMREFTAAQADDLYELVTERIGRPGRSLILTSNRSPAKAHMFAATCVRRQPKMHGFAGGEGGSAAAGKREPSYQPGKSAPPTSRWPDRGGRLSGLTVTHPAASIQCAVVGPARVRVAGLGPGRDNGSMVPAGEALAYLRTATEDLVAVISGLSDSAVRGPSLLPGWSRGHVLTHLARNAEGGVRLLGWARTGVPSYEYESVEARAAAIEDGAGRLAVVLIDEVRRAADAFSAAAAGMPSEAWDRKVRWTAGQESPASLIVPSRWGEVLIHHVDLDIGYQPADWPSVFTGELLPFIVSDLSGRGAMDAVRLKATDAGRVFTIGEITPASLTIAGPACELLAWLLGRSDGGRLARKPDAPLPAVPAIY